VLQTILRFMTRLAHYWTRCAVTFAVSIDSLHSWLKCEHGFAVRQIAARSLYLLTTHPQYHHFNLIDFVEDGLSRLIFPSN